MTDTWIIYKLIDAQGVVRRIGQCVARREISREKEHKKDFPNLKLVVCMRDLPTEDHALDWERDFKRLYHTGKQNGGLNDNEEREGNCKNLSPEASSKGGKTSIKKMPIEIKIKGGKEAGYKTGGNEANNKKMQDKLTSDTKSRCGSVKRSEKENKELYNKIMELESEGISRTKIGKIIGVSGSAISQIVLRYERKRFKKRINGKQVMVNLITGTHTKHFPESQVAEWCAAAGVKVPPRL